MASKSSIARGRISSRAVSKGGTGMYSSESACGSGSLLYRLFVLRLGFHIHNLLVQQLPSIVLAGLVGGRSVHPADSLQCSDHFRQSHFWNAEAMLQPNGAKSSLEC